MGEASERPDASQGHPREWPSTPYSDEARAAEPPMDVASCIALIGDCTVCCDYLPPANRPESHLAVRLRRAFPGQPFVIRNRSDNGGTARGFLEMGGVDGLFAAMPRLHVAFLRFGVNDRKRDGVAACVRYLALLCERLRGRYPQLAIVIETGLWVDYPDHYMWDRNARLALLYDAMRSMSREAGCELLDIFDMTRAEVERGNWDLRVRGLPDPKHTIVDGSFDGFFGDDPAFFTNIHPNSRCLGLIAEWRVEKLVELFGGRLPGAVV